MKKLKSVGILALLLIFLMRVEAANPNIEGQWKNAKARVTVLVEKTYDGIRVKRMDQSEWIKYEMTRADQFRDDKGNTYLLRSDGNLEWESHDGRRRLVFAKHQDRITQYRDPKREVTTHIERNYYYGNNAYRSLEGKWINKSTGQAIWIKERKRSIKVKARRSGWVTFRPRNRQSFVDNHGNRYQIKNGRLTYTSYSGDFYMRFVRQ